MATLKYLSLVIMLVQNAITPLIFRYATTEANQSDRFDVGTAVMIQEMLKLVLSFLLVVLEERGLGQALGVLNAEIIMKPTDTLKLAVPAILYFVQNQCLQLATSNLPAAVFQVMYQGKTLIVALFSIILLSKELSRAKWAAIGIMGLGLAVVQTAKNEEKAQASMANSAEQSMLMGLLFTLTAACCSGFAGVYFEKMMKTPNSANQAKPSMWVRNMQLAGFSIIVGMAQVFLARLTGNDDRGLLHGFTNMVWVMVFNNAVGGLCVAFVIKYADNILKGFACALATVLAAVMAVPLFGFTLNPIFIVGTGIVLVSTLVYGGTIKIPGDEEYWTTEPETCAKFRNKNNVDSSSVGVV